MTVTKLAPCVSRRLFRKALSDARTAISEQQEADVRALYVAGLGKTAERLAGVVKAGRGECN